MKRLFPTPGLSATCLLASSLIGTTAIAQDNNTENKNTIKETIVVIGEKTDRTLKDTTSSVSVITEDSLKTTQFNSITNAISEIPNVISLSGAVPDIRGVSGNGSAGGFNSISGGAKARVSILVDGVAEPFVADLTGDSGLWDIEQIEVFRGPQSTNNGRNSIAGSVYIKTKDPSDELEGAVRVGYRTEEGYIDTAFAVSAPIVKDTLAFRLSAQRVDGNTLTNDTGYDTNPPNYDLNELATNRVRAKLQWTPIENLKTILTHSTNNERGDAGRIYYAASDIDAHQRIFFRNIETDSATTSINVDYQFTDDTSVEVLLAHMDYQWGFDSYESSIEVQQYLTFDETNQTFDTKLNFGQSNNTLNGFIGIAYFQREHDILSTNAFEYNGYDESESSSAYGEVTVGVSDKLNLIVGARLEKESQFRDFTYGEIHSQLDISNSIFLPKLVLQYEINEETTLALSAREGYNAGGGALNVTEQEYYYYDEETVSTLELSSRSNLANDKFFISANVFYNVYEGYQALSSTRFITNMEEAVTYGLELEAKVLPTSNVEINLGLGLLGTEITDAGESYTEVNGNELNSAPAFTVSVGTKYCFNDAFSAGVSANYVGEYYGDFANTETRVGSDYTLVRINASYEEGPYLITAFINNALNEEAILSQEPISGRYPDGYASIVDPRNIGIALTYSF